MTISSLRYVFRACLLLVICIIPLSATAANYFVSPLVVDHELEKRDLREETITITNNEGRMVTLYPTVNEVSVNQGGGVHTFVEPSMTDRTTSVTSWLEISRAVVELMPGETKNLTLTIRVNPEVVPGEYHAFIGFPEGGNRPEAEKQVREGQVPGTVVRIGVDKVQNQFLRLAKFTVERFIKSSTEGEVSYALQNPGDDPVIPRGEVIFYDNNGVEVNSIEVNKGGAVIEGGGEMSFVEEIPQDMKMGKYKAFLAIEYGEHQTASLNDTAFFYVLPLTTIAIIFAVVLMVAIGLALFVHRRYDMGVDDDDAGVADVAMYVRQTRSESKDHDIDLSQKNK